MHFTDFEIKNFKGIKNTKISLNSTGDKGGVTTLIGLNESGKTTILEAISMFEDPDENVTELVGIQEYTNPTTIIPKNMAAAFTGTISIRANLKTNAADITAIAEHIEKTLKLKIDKTKFKENFYVIVEREYTDSILTRKGSKWSTTFHLRKSKGKYKEYGGNEKTAPKEEMDIWRSIVRFIRKRFPKIVYLPTFLFNLPDKIYLKEDQNGSNGYLMRIIQGILDEQATGLNLQTHVVDRIKKIKTTANKEGGPSFLKMLMSSQEKELIDAVAQKTSHALTRVVFGSWRQILGGKISNQRVDIKWIVDPDEGDTPYFQLSIVDGDHSFKLSERSVGFRWFFSFFLLIHLPRMTESSGIIFLLDEPASNLHPRAQTKLMESFQNIVSKPKSIIYSTHSHYLINPIWLESAYIIRNISHEEKDDGDVLSSIDIDIKATKYKTFAGSHPNKQSYFQPVLDALDISFSPLVRAANALIVEGKSDYYALKYFQREFDPNNEITIFPADGSGGMSTLISLFRGWGSNFVILLDSDDAGKKEKSRYIEKFNLSENEILSIGDFSNIPNAELEDLFQEDVKQYLTESVGITALKKKQFWILFHELISKTNFIDFPDTKIFFGNIFESAKEKSKKQI